MSFEDTKNKYAAKALTPEQETLTEELREVFVAVATGLDNFLTAGRELALAQTKLEEAFGWAMKAI
ncbi:hypothetical protein ACFU44_00445 [Nocardia rhizosphaerihabitans]|uniref:Acb2/Tad1 domain-containing protein n=1 Tax=Nocardia rhizosphaerihabitans TaxID=1691570 RepID=UPI00366AB0B8